MVHDIETRQEPSLFYSKNNKNKQKPFYHQHNKSRKLSLRQQQKLSSCRMCDLKNNRVIEVVSKTIPYVCFTFVEQVFHFRFQMGLA